MVRSNQEGEGSDYFDLGNKANSVYGFAVTGADLARILTPPTFSSQFGGYTTDIKKLGSLLRRYATILIVWMEFLTVPKYRRYKSKYYDQANNSYN
jgi:hypothetical protein